VSQLYARNKKYAVMKAAQVLADTQACQNAASELFAAASNSKKDDLADSFLLGYYYLLKHVKTKSKGGTRVKRTPSLQAASGCVPQTQAVL
jgi:hypothetical protein